MANDYYVELGVNRSASAEEIQKAYRRLARKHHPDLADDKNAAKEKFQKIQHAYDVLSDPEKRQLYDQLGPEFERAGGNPFQGGQMPEGMDLEQIFGKGKTPVGGFEEILKQVFGAGAGGGGFYPGGTQTQAPPRPPAKGMDLEQSVTIPFATAVLGGKHQISLKRSSGSVDNITFSVPAGISDGKKIRLRGQGSSTASGAPRGDLLVKVKIAPHPVYQRNGDNLHVSLPVTISEAMEGARIDLPTPHGEVAVTIPAGSSGGKLLRLKGMGIKRSSSSSGDLIVELRIVVPENLDDNQLQLLKAFTDSAGNANPRGEIKW